MGLLSTDYDQPPLADYGFSAPDPVDVNNPWLQAYAANYDTYEQDFRINPNAQYQKYSMLNETPDEFSTDIGIKGGVQGNEDVYHQRSQGNNENRPRWDGEKWIGGPFANRTGTGDFSFGGFDPMAASRWDKIQTGLKYGGLVSGLSGLAAIPAGMHATSLANDLYSKKYAGQFAQEPIGFIEDIMTPDWMTEEYNGVTETSSPLDLHRRNYHKALTEYAKTVEFDGTGFTAETDPDKIAADLPPSLIDITDANMMAATDPNYAMGGGVEDDDFDFGPYASNTAENPGGAPSAELDALMGLGLLDAGQTSPYPSNIYRFDGIDQSLIDGLGYANYGTTSPTGPDPQALAAIRQEQEYQALGEVMAAQARLDRFNRGPGGFGGSISGRDYDREHDDGWSE